ncbi:MAG: hypothetical protein QM778_18450 [Myxococcales bacterium]
MTPSEQALSKVPEARGWVGNAIGALDGVITFNGRREEIKDLNQFKAANEHFHVELEPAPGIVGQLLRLLPFFPETDVTLALLTEIRRQYFDLLQAFSRATFVDAPPGGGQENVGAAPAFVPRERDGTLRITPHFQELGPLCQVHCLVHEGTHFLSSEFQDFAYRDRTGEPDPNKYIQLPVENAIRNPDSYAYFALQAARGIDRVLSREE